MQFKKFKNTTNRLKINYKLAINRMRKFAITSIAAATIVVGTPEVNSAFANSEEFALSTIYYVYINDEYLGMINDKEKVESIVKKKIDSLKDTYKDFKLSADSLVLIPEMVFNPVTSNETTLKNINTKLAITTEAVAMQIDEKSVAHFKDEETVKKVLEKLKTKYVPVEQLEILEARKNKDSLPPLEEGQSRLLDVKLDKEVSVIKSEVPPQQILDVDNGVKLLLKGTLEEKKYKVKEGDVLGSIAIAHDLSLKQLLALNPGLKEDSLINIDDELNVTQYEPYIHVIVEREHYTKSPIAYEKEVVNSNSMYKGDSKVKQEGKLGKKLINYVTTESNGAQVSRTVLKEDVVREPVNEIIVKGTKVTPSRGSGSLTWPTNGGYISSRVGQRWGQHHKGIDIARPSNYTIKAADNGVVAYAGWDGGYGNKIVINHNNGMRTVYAHLSSISVKSGQTVAKGSKIGVMGSTGNSTGTHLHFEVYKNGSLQNPLNYLR